MAPASWIPSEPKIILDNISAAVNPGHFVSIIGASGIKFSCFKLNFNDYV
jgi:ABC-type nitrate/sulfonate/bicarbonate transport system ATPase subunit